MCIEIYITCDDNVGNLATNIGNNETQKSWFTSKYSRIYSFLVSVLSNYASTIIYYTKTVSISFNGNTLPEAIVYDNYYSSSGIFTLSSS